MSMMLDTRVVAPADRSEYWSAGIAEHYFPMRVESFGSPSFEARLSGGAVGPLVIRSITALPHRVVRTPRMVASADPESILLYLVRSGVCRVEQDDRSCELQAGDVAVQDTSRASSFEAATSLDVLVLTFPKWFLGAHADAIAARTATRAAGADRPLLQMTAPMFAAVARMAEGAHDDVDGVTAAEMLLPVVRGLFGDLDADRAAGRSGLLHARMQQYARAHLRDPELGPEQIAQAHYVSTRYVHKLFAASGGVSAWIRAQRLEAAAHELRTTDSAVFEIAGRWGYRDAASFSRAFRKSLGRSPREVRSEA